MADKKRIREAMKNGVFESPVNDNLQIAGTELKSKENEFEITVGDEARRSLKQLGIKENTNGVMVIPAHNTVKKEKEEASR